MKLLAAFQQLLDVAGRDVVELRVLPSTDLPSDTLIVRQLNLDSHVAEKQTAELVILRFGDEIVESESFVEKLLWELSEEGLVSLLRDLPRVLLPHVVCNFTQQRLSIHFRMMMFLVEGY